LLLESRSVTIRELLNRIRITGAGFFKLDLEGAEYERLRNASREKCTAFGQISVEFHHHAAPSCSVQDTRQVVAAVAANGLRVFSVDDHIAFSTNEQTGKTVTRWPFV
jgi:hypothetical protein